MIDIAVQLYGGFYHDSATPVSGHNKLLLASHILAAWTELAKAICDTFLHCANTMKIICDSWSLPWWIMHIVMQLHGCLCHDW